MNRLGWCALLIVGFTSFGCTRSGPPASFLPNTQRLETSHNDDGIQFTTTTSPPLPVWLAPGSKIGLLHEDRDEADQFVRVALEHAIFSLKASTPDLVVVERRSLADLEKEYVFQASGKVKDQELARIGHFLGLDYVVVFDTLYRDMNDLYGLRNQIDTWEVTLPVKVIAVDSAEVKLHCLASAKANVRKQMTAVEVRLLNQKALSITTTLVNQCLSASLQRSSPR